jgi:signal peptidase I
MSTILLLASLLIVAFLLNAFLLKAAGRLFAQTVGWGRALLGVAILTVVGFGLALILAQPSADIRLVVLKLAAAFAVNLFLIWMIATWAARTNVGRGALIGIMWLVFTVACGIATAVAFKKFVVEAYVIPTHSMSPTLSGPHADCACPKCGVTAIVPAYEPGPDSDIVQLRQKEEGEWAICPSCLQISNTRKWSEKVHPADRIFCNKLLTPRRWDLIVYRYPRRPEILYVNRLVGLPGEKVTIKQGVIWINGKQAELPEEIKGLRALSDVLLGFHDNIEQAFENDDPGKTFDVGPGGYFVLGDFTNRSSDSREWGDVPVENLVGVVTLIYWPPERWRVFR